jgi:hypothetical protein
MLACGAKALHGKMHDPINGSYSRRDATLAKKNKELEQQNNSPFW